MESMERKNSQSYDDVASIVVPTYVVQRRSYWIYFGVARCWLQPCQRGWLAASSAPRTSSRFARRSRIPASFAMGFIPAITPRIYPPPVSNLILPPFVRPWCNSAVIVSIAGEESILLTLNLRPIHRNESKWREAERERERPQINQSLDSASIPMSSSRRAFWFSFTGLVPPCY